MEVAGVPVVVTPSVGSGSAEVFADDRSGSAEVTAGAGSGSAEVAGEPPAVAGVPVSAAGVPLEVAGAPLDVAVVVSVSSLCALPSCGLAVEEAVSEEVAVGDGAAEVAVGVGSVGTSVSVLLVHCVPFHQRMVLGWPVGSGYQPAGGLLMGSP